jgi:hypothetical protein
LLLAAFAAAALSASPALAQTKWNLPAAYPANNPHSENLVLFAKDVSAATGGKLDITVHPAASLFKAPDIKRAVQTGQAQMGEVLMSLHENEDPIYGIDVVPFLAASYPEAMKLWQVSKPAVEKKLASQGMVLLFAVPWAPQGIFANKEINSVADMKGLKWRSYNVGTAKIGELVGAQSVTVQAAELAQALATGVVNSFITSAATGYDSKSWESVKYFYDTKAWLPRNAVLVGQRAWAALDRATQEAVLRSAAEAETRGWALSEEKARWYMEQLALKGMKVEAPSAQLNADMKKVGEVMTAEWLKTAGAEGEAILTAYRR